MSSLNAIQAFISQYQVLFVSLGVPILTVLISWFVAVQTNRTSRRLAEKERALGIELKLAEFRQAWIDGLRSDLALYVAATFPNSDGIVPDSRLPEIVTLGARLVMRMNSSDPDYATFQAAMSHALPSSPEDVAAARNNPSVTAIGQRILKREWERLKSDLNAIEKKRLS